jgi:hypothetical protein
MLEVLNLFLRMRFFYKESIELNLIYQYLSQNYYQANYHSKKQGHKSLDKNYHKIE